MTALDSERTIRKGTSIPEKGRLAQWETVESVTATSGQGKPSVALASGLDRFLLDGPAYRWLLENARSSALLTRREGTVLEAASREIDGVFSSQRAGQKRQVCFDMSWSPHEFLRDQEYGVTDEIAFERAITITGSARNAQALTCVEYMRQTWPSSGSELIRTLQKALVTPGQSSRQYIQLTA